MHRNGGSYTRYSHVVAEDHVAAKDENITAAVAAALAGTADVLGTLLVPLLLSLLGSRRAAAAVTTSAGAASMRSTPPPASAAATPFCDQRSEHV